MTTSSELPGFRRLWNTGCSPVTLRPPSTVAVVNSGTCGPSHLPAHFC